MISVEDLQAFELQVHHEMHISLHVPRHCTQIRLVIVYAVRKALCIAHLRWSNGKNYGLDLNRQPSPDRVSDYSCDLALQKLEGIVAA